MDVHAAPGVHRHPVAGFLAKWAAAVTTAATVAVGVVITCAGVTSAAPAAAPAAPPARSGPASRPAARTPDAVREAMASVLAEARAAAEKEGVRTVVALASFGRDGATPLPAFVQDTLRNAFDGGPALAPPPAAVKAPPSPLNPATLARLRWQTKDAKDAKEVPTVLAAVATPTRDGTDLVLTLLDGKRELWHGSLQLTRQEVAALPLTPPVNQKVLKFATDHRGEQVGNGECWTLADEALKAAGTTHPATYVWGRPLADGETVLPGDVVQFTSVRLEKGGSWVTLGSPNHTALIERVTAPGVYVLIHQNYGGRTVKETTVDLNTKTKGEVVIYRPQAPKGR